MTNTKEKPPLEISVDVQEELKPVIKEGQRVLNLKKLVSEVKDFDIRHEERRKKLKNGTRRRTSGRIL